MSNWSFEEAAVFENRFWLQILGDHARFILTSMSPDETEVIARAQRFVTIFDELLIIARQNLSGSDIVALNQQAAENACAIREFKLDLLRRHLVGNIKTHLPPTFFNHMVNEVEDYLSILQFLIEKQAPMPQHPLRLHLLWLDDAGGHAAAIAANLDDTETDLFKQAEAFKEQFDGLFEKTHELNGYLRTGLTQFPAHSRLNMQADESVIAFTAYLQEIKMLVESKEVLSTLLPLMPDHMQREECYYLTKLAIVSDIKRPNCDPAKPRVE